MTLTARVKSGLSALLMEEAWRLAALCRTIEKDEQHLPWPQPRQSDNKGHAAGAVVMACAALEASINEIYLRAGDRDYSLFTKISSEQVDLISELWDVVETARAGVLKKHDVALTAVNQSRISTSSEPGQSVAGTIALRDLLVHFKPEWEGELDRHSKIENRLRGKFEMNKLSAQAEGHMLWFPGHCLGAGCAVWACESALAYHREFTTRIGVTSHLPAS